jgi:hypothetical protein
MKKPNIMKNFTPTLNYLFALLISSSLNAQIENVFHSDNQNLLKDSDYELLEYQTKNEYQDAIENFNQVSRLVPVVYNFNGTWTPSSPIGLSNSSDTIILESGTVTISASTVCDNLIVNPGAAVIISSGVTLTCTVMDLQSTSQLFSSLISNGTVEGLLNYHRFTSQIGINDLISSPVSNQTFETFASTNDGELAASGLIRAFAPFNTSSGAYENYDVVTNATTVIEPAMGYRAATLVGSLLTFSGLLNEVDVLDVSISDSPSSGSWNLIGNPYPSYLDFDAFFTLNKSQLDGSSNQAIYGYDGDASNGWIVWNQATIDSPVITELIAPAQAFFVKAKVGGGLIDFTTSMRSIGDSDDFISGRSSTSPHYGYLKLNLNSGTSNFNTDFYFNHNATEGFDPGYDSALFNSTAPAFAIYSHLIEDNTGIPFAVQASNPDSINSIIVPLGVNASQGQEITISIISSDLSDTVDVFLEDTSNNTSTQLTTNNFIITPNADLSGTGRFFLRFESESLTQNESTLDAFDIYMNDREKAIIIFGDPLNVITAKLFDINGRIVSSHNLRSTLSRRTIDTSLLSPGIYVIELRGDSNERLVKKLVIR